MSQSQAPKIESDLLLLVEGIDDKKVFEAAQVAGKISGRWQVLPIAGKSKLRENLKTLKADPEFPSVRRLLIARDADDDSSAAFKSVCDSLAAADLSPPTEPGSLGAEMASMPRAGVFILPGSSRSGMIETLCLESVQTKPGFACVAAFLDCLRQAQVPEPRQIDKARAHVWLAAQADPDKRVGEGALAGYWNLSHPAFEAVWRWIAEATPD